MRQPAPRPATIVPPFTRADQCQLDALLEHLRAHSPAEMPFSALERLLCALPALRTRLPDEQQRLVAELDRSEEMLNNALQQLHGQREQLERYQHGPLDNAAQLQQLEDLATQLAQHAAEAALRAAQRREVLSSLESR